MDLIVWEMYCEEEDGSFSNYEFRKKRVLTKYISFESETGLRAYSHNDFVLKVPYGEELIDVGDYVLPQGTEFGGKILERVIDTENSVVEYTGVTLRGWLETQTVNTSHTVTLNSANALWTAAASIPYIIATTDVPDVKEFSFASTSGLLYTNLLYIADKISRSYNQKFKMELRDSAMRVKYSAVNEYFYDSSSTNVVVDENKLSPRFLMGCFNYEENGEKIKDAVIAWIGADGKATTEGTVPEIKYDERRYVVVEVNGETDEEREEDARNQLDDMQVKNTSEVKIDVHEGEIGDIVTASVAELGYKESKRISVIELKLTDGIPEFTYRLEE